MDHFAETEKLAASIFAQNGCEQYTVLLPRFSAFGDLLLRENEKHNLTAIRSAEDVWLRHFADCLLFADFFNTRATLIDVGCGGGFPSVPLALACPALKVTACDSTKKKTDFVSLAAQTLALENLRTLCARAEEAGKSPVWRERFDFASARAVSALPALAEYCLPLVRVGGCFAAFKGKDAEVELAAAEPMIANLGGKTDRILHKTLLAPDGEAIERSLIIIRKIRPTPAVFPRKNSVIQRAKTRT